MSEGLGATDFSEIQGMLNHKNYNGATRLILKFKARFPNDPGIRLLHARLQFITGVLPPNIILDSLKTLPLDEIKKWGMEGFYEELQLHSRSSQGTTPLKKTDNGEKILRSSGGSNPIDFFGLRNLVHLLDEGRTSEVRPQIVRELARVDDPLVQKYFLIRLQYQDDLETPDKLYQELSQTSGVGAFPELSVLLDKLKKGPYIPPEDSKKGESKGLLAKANLHSNTPKEVAVHFIDGEISEGVFKEFITILGVFYLLGWGLNLLFRTINIPQPLIQQLVPPLFYLFFSGLFLISLFSPFRHLKSERFFFLTFIFHIPAQLACEGFLFGAPLPGSHLTLQGLVWWTVFFLTPLGPTLYYAKSFFLSCINCKKEVAPQVFEIFVSEPEKTGNLFKEGLLEKFLEKIGPKGGDKTLYPNPLFIFYCPKCKKDPAISLGHFYPPLKKELNSPHRKINGIPFDTLKKGFPNWDLSLYEDEDGVKGEE